MSPLRVLIVDDHPMFRLGLATALQDMDGVELVGQAETVAEVEAAVATEEPDIVLLDVRLRDGSGLGVNRWLAEHHPHVKVVMLTMSEDHDTVLTALLTAGPFVRRSEFGDGPRAGFCVMGACQDCWVFLETGARIRACTSMAADGMRLSLDGPRA